MGIYKALAAFFILFFLIQVTAYYIAGVHINGVFEFLPLALNVDSTWLAEHRMADRFSSFFSEPAHFAQFLLPLLCYFLFSDRETYRKKIIWSVIIVFVLLLLRSGNGVLGLLTIFIAYGIYTVAFKSWSIKKILLLLFAIPLFLYLGVAYSQSEAGAALLERSSSIGMSSEAGYHGSGYLRTWRGWLLYADLPLKGKIFGVGDNQNLVTSINQSSIWADFVDENDTYMNGIQAILVNTGLVGASIFLVFLFSLWKGNTYEGKIQVLVLIVLSLISANYLTETMVLSLLLSQFAKKDKQEEL